MTLLANITVLDTYVYFIAESDLSEFRDEPGWYSDVSYSDGGVDVFGPYDSEEDARESVY